MFSATMICDSISPEGIRLVTMKLRYPRIIHAEVMTHRMFSRNASGSRAVPTKKLLEECRSDELRASPIFWGKNQPGMQADEELSDVNDGLDLYHLDDKDGDKSDEPMSPRQRVQERWKAAAMAAAVQADWMLKDGAHKQIVNRLLEPFTHINVLVTATEWQNFFGLRLDKAAQPEIRHLAELMWAAMKGSTPLKLKPGQWHLPYVTKEEIYRDFDLGYLAVAEVELADGVPVIRVLSVLDLPRLVKVSVARCARVSFESFETLKPSTVEEDVKLYHEKLLGGQPFHATPGEHQATPDENIAARPGSEFWRHQNLWGNFRGWCQFRKMLPGENKAPLPEGYEL